MESRTSSPDLVLHRRHAADLRDYHRRGGNLRLRSSPPPVEQRVALCELHADIWWGLLLVILGAFYCLRLPSVAQSELIENKDRPNNNGNVLLTLRVRRRRHAEKM